LLEKEMVLNELLLVSSAHTSKGVEGTLEVTFEGVASGDNLVHDLITLFLGNTGTERVTIKVTSNTDAGRNNHSGLILGKGRAVHFCGVHLGGVDSVGSVTVVVLDDLVEEIAESLVRVVGTSVTANAGIDVLAAREQAGLERDTTLVRDILVLVPVILTEETGNS